MAGSFHREICFLLHQFWTQLFDQGTDILDACRLSDSRRLDGNLELREICTVALFVRLGSGKHDLSGQNFIERVLKLHFAADACSQVILV